MYTTLLILDTVVVAGAIEFMPLECRAALLQGLRKATLGLRFTLVYLGLRGRDGVRYGAVLSVAPDPQQESSAGILNHWIHDYYLHVRCNKYNRLPPDNPLPSMILSANYGIRSYDCDWGSADRTKASSLRFHQSFAHKAGRR